MKIMLFFQMYPANTLDLMRCYCQTRCAIGNAYYYHSIVALDHIQFERALDHHIQRVII